MTEKKKRRVNRNHFGSVRQLPSGRWQGRYPDERGLPMVAPRTFDTRAEAESHLAEVRADRARGVYHDPRSGGVMFGTFAREWIENGGSRGTLAPRTRELYLDILTRQLLPYFDGMTLEAIRADTVRRWYRGMQAAYAAKNLTGYRSTAPVGSTRMRQAYALLRAIMATALADGRVRANPCAIRGAGVATSPERPSLSIVDFMRVVEAHPEPLRPLLHLALGAHLRLGELLALQRGDLDLKTGMLRVERQLVTVAGTEVITKTKTGKGRAVMLPAVTVDIIASYLASKAKALPRAPLFTQADGEPYSRTQIQRAWRKAARGLGLGEFHLHDLRHSGLTIAAQSGATVRELMDRAGHSTSAAAMRYQHAAEERGSIIAAGMNTALEGLSGGPTGTGLARTASGTTGSQLDGPR